MHSCLEVFLSFNEGMNETRPHSVVTRQPRKIYVLLLERMPKILNFSKRLVPQPFILS